jgi:hypothetical protein
MWHKTARDERVIGIRVVHQLRAFAKALGSTIGPGSREVNDRSAHHRAHMHVHGGFCDDLREEILVAETGASGLEHFRDRKPRSVAHQLGAHPAVFDRPDAFLEPAFQGQVVRDPP